MKRMKKTMAALVLVAVATMGTPQAFAGIMLGDRTSGGCNQTGIMLGDRVGTCQQTGIMLGDFARFGGVELTGIMLGD